MQKSQINDMFWLKVAFSSGLRYSFTSTFFLFNLITSSIANSFSTITLAINHASTYETPEIVMIQYANF